jgi:DNA-binding GntR family transcriptional regulator
MNESFLAAVPRVRRTDPGTSHEAALMAGGLAKGQHGLIRDLLIAHRDKGGEPLGAEQIGERLGIHACEIRKRLPELESDGEIRVVGERKTKGGRTERTWELTF